MNAYIIPGLAKQKGRANEINLIFNSVCGYFGQQPNEILKLNKKRVKPAREIRQITMYLAINYRGIGPTAAARFFDLDHSTGIHSKKTITKDLKTDKYFKGNLIPLLNNYTTVETYNKVFK